MKEDLAEWLQTLYPELMINIDNFMDRLETGVALCKHANNVKRFAADYVQRRQARSKIMTRSTTSSLALPLTTIMDVHYLPLAKPGTFFARDNVHNFISWCRKSLTIIECLLFETDDLIMRKNEKHVILCLLEVARRGAKFGMLAPMLVQMERQIDREIAAEQRLQKESRGTQSELIATDGAGDGDDEESDSELEDEQPMLMYGPMPQIVTNDLKSLDEMVRDLVEKCTCPTQFPMIRVSEGKYRIGDTKVLIFVRILRSHVMVRVGGGWDTLAHYLDKHDPCRCRSQHRTTQGARLVSRPGGADLVGAHVYYDRSPPRTRRNSVNNNPNNSSPQKDYLGPPMNSINRSRSRSPTSGSKNIDRRSVSPSRRSPNMGRNHSLIPPNTRSRSPTPHFVSTQVGKVTQKSSRTRSRSPTPSYIPNTSPKVKNQQPSPNLNTRSRSPTPNLKSSPKHSSATNTSSSHVTSIQIPLDNKVNLVSEASLQISDPTSTDHSDNASEVSDEGYRSLGIIQTTDKTKANRLSYNSQNSVEDAEYNEHPESSETKPEDHLDDIYNDTGLRKTNFSDIYNDSLDKPKITRGRSLEVQMPRSRSNSTDRSNLQETSPFKRSSVVYRSAKPSTNSSKVNNTWNGPKPKQRPSVASDTFSKQSFSRNNTSRGSVRSNYDHNGRRVHSTNSSPTKSPLCQEILKTAETVNDDSQMLEKLKDLLKQYSTLNKEDDDDNLDDLNSWVQNQNDTEQHSQINQKKNPEAKTFTSPRKDLKADAKISKIPAPVFKRSTLNLC